MSRFARGSTVGALPEKNLIEIKSECSRFLAKKLTKCQVFRRVGSAKDLLQNKNLITTKSEWSQFDSAEQND